MVPASVVTVASLGRVWGQSQLVKLKLYSTGNTKCSMGVRWKSDSTSALFCSKTHCIENVADGDALPFVVRVAPSRKHISENSSRAQCPRKLH
ncbi:hypothetical protein PF010_g27216 [Phytophthora fragariae]|uniref:Uncharacterized protein n=1 Tax=Phytophthora fragariae TaxID=53985 RepID=A0A6A3JAS8_9STRA|nr:hypothetical protein PF011_g17844 [Phytophthora fragariae]KAE9068065.1 hypothetical protein PF010_g27216 [Phytophthora fragariae]KAE9174456.1 hypothetical protein PF004_g26656 [Phytophthora fragariae]KAE9283238.1 hypothetical protein PF008_g27455 [Phytophthora fragariae]